MRRRGFAFGKPFNRTDIPPALQHAHELMGLGQYAEAAEAFEQLAAGAEKRQGPRAPFLFVQAGHARLLLNQTEAAMAQFSHGLNLFSTSGRYQKYFQVGNRITQELSMRGLEKEAQQIADLLNAKISRNPKFMEEPGKQPASAILPTHCPSCGGPMRSDEVDWIDSNSAECSFCGSPVRAQ